MSSRRRVHPLTEDRLSKRPVKPPASLSPRPPSVSVNVADGLQPKARRAKLPPIAGLRASNQRASLQSAGVLTSKQTPAVPLRTQSSSSAALDPLQQSQAGSPGLELERNVSCVRRTTKRLHSADSHLEIFREERQGRRTVDMASKRAVQLQNKAETQRQRLASVESTSHPSATYVSFRPAARAASSVHSVPVNGLPSGSPAMADDETVTERVVTQQEGRQSGNCIMALERLSRHQEEFERSHLIPLAAVGISTIPMSVAASHFTLDDRSLLVYLAKLSAAEEEDVRVDFSFVDHLISKGANVNALDDIGQSILHAVAKDWGADVVECLVSYGAHLDLQDHFGRTPLHVAALTNATDVIRALLEHGADHTLCTHGENQSPLHFAARSDAVEALTALLEMNADIERRDYKGRTPIQLAAELDRSESVRCLLDVKPTAANAGVSDYSGHMALTSMVATMPPVTRNALNQFHRTSRVHRKQLFYLNLLERPPPERTGSGHSKAIRSPLEMVVHHHHHDLIMHPVIKRLIKIKWKQFGRIGSVLQLIIFLIFLVTLTLSAVAVDFEKKYEYEPLSENWWRLFAIAVSFLLFVYQVSEELSEIYRSRKQHKRFVAWRKAELEKDMKYCHPRFPEEKEYLKQEMAKLGDSAAVYFSEAWNYVDWLSYALLLAAFVSHVVDIFAHSNTLARVHARLMCIALIVAWFRLLKYVRAFSVIGPLVVILQSMAADVCRYSFLYFVIYIPYAASFWIFFGDRGVSGFQSVSAGLFSLFRITLVDEYAYDQMHNEDSIMAYILVGSFLALAAVVSLNLLIALMSDTFQRVYDNAKANAIMQKASIILSLEEKLTKSKLHEIRREIHERCGPLEEFFDDDDDEGQDLKKMTFQIYDEVLELKNSIEDLHDTVTVQTENESATIAQLQEEIAELKDSMRTMSVVQTQTPLATNERSPVE